MAGDGVRTLMALLRYAGKVVGGVVGWVVTRHPLGLAAGVLIGHAYDAGWLAATRTQDADAPPVAKPTPLAEAYETLGIEASASDAQLDRAYRSLMGRFHPDKVAGAADAVRADAEQKARAINAAYDRIRDSRRARR